MLKCMAKTTIAFIEDDPFYRELLTATFERDARFEILGAFASGAEAVAALSPAGADVVIVDLRLDGASGIQVIRELRGLWPQRAFIVLTGSEQDGDIFAALDAGAAGYLLKTDSPAFIVAQVHEVVAGGVALSRPIARRLVGSFSDRKRDRRSRANLTPREAEIMDELALGRTYKEIGTSLGISVATVKNHLYRIYEKLGVRSRTDAVVSWLRH